MPAAWPLLLALLASEGSSGEPPPSPTAASSGGQAHAAERDRFEWPGTTEAALGSLAGPDRAARLRALERAGGHFGPEVQARVLPLLKDPDPQVRTAAMRLLARRGVPEAIEAAVQATLSMSAHDRATGLDLLREVDQLPVAARRAVERALGDAEPQTRLMALEVLWRHPPARGALAPVAAALDDDVREIRVRAIRVLKRTGDRAAAVPLLARLSDSDRQVRVEAIRAVGYLGELRVVPALERQMEDQPDEVKVAAVEALGRLRAARSVPLLATLAARRPAGEVTRQAQLALGEIGTEDAIAALVAETREPAPPQEVLEGLRRAGTRAVPALARELAHGGHASSVVAARLLGEIGDRRATAGLAQAVDRRTGATPAALMALATLADPEAVPALLRAATDAATSTRLLAYDALLKTLDDRAGAVVARGLADPTPSIRVRALRLVTALRSAPHPATVLNLVNAPEPEVRLEALRAVASARPAGAIGSLLASAGRAQGLSRPERDALGDALESVATAKDSAALAEAVMRAPRVDREALVPLTRGLAAASAGAGRPTPAAIASTLIALLPDGDALAEAAADALASGGVPTALEEKLLVAFALADTPGRARLTEALAATATERTRDRINGLLEDGTAPDEVRAAAAWAARRLTRHPPVREALSRLTTSPNPRFAANARAALAVTAPPPASWVAARLVAPNGSRLPRAWAAVMTPDGTTIWARAGAQGDLRVQGLPPGPYQLRPRQDLAARLIAE